MHGKILLTYFLILLSCLNCALISQTKVIPYQELPTSNGLPTGSGIFFGATMSAASVTMSFAGPSDRWIALGLGINMYPADVLIYSNGKIGATHPLGWNDYYNSSGGSPGVNNDGTQDWTILSTATVAPGQRTVTVSRVLNTGDANDVAISFSATTLDLIWAHGATSDYTIAYHGSSNRAFFISLPWLSVPVASFVATPTVCAGSARVYTNTSVGGQTSYTWNFAGGSPATSTLTNPSVIYNTPGTYSVSLTASNVIGSNTYSVLNYVTVTPTVAPSISIALTSGSNPMCAGASVGFSATVLNGGANPSFQWLVGGANAGVNNPLFTTNLLTNSTNITCVLISNATCPVPATATSAAISMTVNSNAAATITISQVSGGNPLCIGSIVGFTAMPGNGGSNPSFQWLVNNSNVGTNSPSFTTSTLSNGDVIGCILSSNAPCASSTLGVASVITMTVSSSLVPGISINSTSNPICAGTSVTISAAAVNGGNTPVYQWQVNGVNSGGNNPVFTSNALSNGNVITCLMTSALQCANPSTVMSSGLTFTVNSIPTTPTITASGSLTFCTGNSVTLTSSAASGNLWSNGAISTSIVVANTASYSVMQSVNGCVSPVSAIVTVTVHLPPIITMSSVAYICKNAPASTLIGLPLGGTFSGSGVTGNLFDPSAVSVGSHNVMYQYTDIATTCSTSLTQTITVEECVGINSNAHENSSIIVYPNPGEGEFTVESKNEKMKNISVIDASGKCIKWYKNIYAERSVIDITGYPNGSYILEVKLEKKTVKLRVSKTDQ